jgi:hypothetical protein
MDLRERGDIALRQSMDHVQLPQRPGAVQRTGEDARDLLGELLVAARRGKRELADVKVQVEVPVVHPVRVVESERDLGELPPERRQERQAFLQQPLHGARVEGPAWRG